MAVIEVKCRYCGQGKVVKNGKAPNGLQRFHCRSCRRYFQVEYLYNGRKPGTAERIVDMVLNGSGVRDTSRVLGSSKTTVIRRLKKLAPAQISSRQQTIDDVALICEMDEQWGWVGNKPQQHRLFYGFDTKRKKVVAHVFGPRTTETLRRLLHLLKGFSIGMFTTDGWPSYQQQICQLKHLVGKIFTQRIEHHNLTLRTHLKRLARRTICFSKSIEIHEKVIGAYIDKFHYQSM